MTTLSFPKHPAGQENLPTIFRLYGLITLATPPVITTGKGFTATRTSQGLYRITLNQGGGRILGAKASLVFPATTTEARFYRGHLPPVQSTSDALGYIEFVITDAAGAVQDPVGLDSLDFTVEMMLTRQPA